MTSGTMTDPSPRHFRFAVLGPLRAWRDGDQLDLGPIRQQALLAALLLRPDLPVSRRELLDGVWGTEPPGSGSKIVPVYVHRLRRCLGTLGEGPHDSVIGRDRGGYRFVSGGTRVDAMRLDEIAAEAATARGSGDLASAVKAYARALGLFQGEPLAGLPGPFAEAERLRLEERRLTLLQEKVECQLRLGRHVEAAGELHALTATHQHSEPLAALLMRALYGSGRQADALAVYAQLRRRLVDDLGVEPGERLRRVHQAVLRADDETLGLAPRREPAATERERARVPRTAPHARRVPDELPADVGEIVGRDEELALLSGGAGATAVTVAAVDGVAGAGKTALAVRAARSMCGGYPDGCLFVALHGHSERRDAVPPERALRRLLRAIGVQDSSDDLDELVAFWRSATAGLRLLLVLDDAAGADQVRPLLPAGAGSRVLVTSRHRLVGLDVDRRVSLGPLAPEAAEALLARIVGGRRAEGERDAVRELARLCDRLPLALRIAGARIQSRPAWTIGHLAHRMADDDRRLEELTAEDRSVEAAFRLSYLRLPAAERHAFRALGRAPAVEIGHRTLAATLGWAAHRAERALENLVDASLVQQPSAHRYLLNGLLALYARRLAAEERHVAGRGGLVAVGSAPGGF
ncbi:AfsR/SARP family transcriptional regulator [Actinomadura viridis]|uniref:DNA-binding SARP family transcriptional activator n=1 Tax=Actinomadura viridis TaxID=58110 RepID=A0A931DS77_9ACTN|nr:AfsR/SARP family transcriptional regulator [Actinomadura viridis]MBG6092997.1 DNA-binding SARP family transcriptional activator [Actinomadura viridis]